jgi:hypothetical protein
MIGRLVENVNAAEDGVGLRKDRRLRRRADPSKVMYWQRSLRSLQRLQELARGCSVVMWHYALV